jgi:hypothetical protein
MLTKIQTYVIVSLFAALIWLYAEGETVRTQQVELYLKFVPPPGKDLVIEGQDQRVAVTFRCSASRLSQVQAVVRDGISLEVVEALDGAAFQDVALAGRLANHPAITRLGATIVDVSPSRVRLRVEAIESHRMPVVGLVEGDVQLASLPVTDVSEAMVRMPASMARQIDPDARIEARVAIRDVPDIDVDVPYTIDVPLTLPESLRNRFVSVAPATAKVTFRIRDMREEHTIPIVPILVLGPPTELGRFAVVLDEDNRVLRDVQVVGPSDVIDRISRRQAEVYAELRLTADELERFVDSTQQKQLFVRLPAGVNLVAAPAPITFQIARVNRP